MSNKWKTLELEKFKKNENAFLILFEENTNKYLEFTIENYWNEWNKQGINALTPIMAYTYIVGFDEKLTIDNF